ncbi:MAG TPA: selenide, water dikinase SelD [Gemmatimonadaceae bacterium]|jgi:selenide,water dikinase|nr:selenide, water dikinase SelD [Gemmatimonadaceae bacterium]
MTTSLLPNELLRLTGYARCAGCAAKLGLGDLSRALEGVPHQEDPRLLVGRETFDDAGVFQLSPDLALVQTVDFFAPIVDDPYLFGQIAAANALSDVYAMGGEPLTALNIVGFPAGTLPLEVLGQILRGGQDKVHEAGAIVVGGHTIIDEELKFGVAVTGRVHPDRVLTNAAARPGDRLVLTKPLGTGLLATAEKQGTLAADDARALHASMGMLNAAASRAAVDLGVRCATDVTGFGLLGHASHIAKASHVTVVVHVARVPSLPGALHAWEAGARTGGAERNLAYLRERVEWNDAPEATRALLLDPQTSGGLLVAVPAAHLADYLARVPGAVEIGEVQPPGSTPIVLA